MQEKISKAQAYELMSDRDKEVLSERLHELSSCVEYGHDEFMSYYVERFYYDEVTHELFYELVNSIDVVVYRNMFLIKKTVGRPSIGKTKKVSITLPEEVWEAIERNKGDESMSAYLRQLILDNYHLENME